MDKIHDKEVATHAENHTPSDGSDVEVLCQSNDHVNGDTDNLHRETATRSIPSS